MNKKFFSGKILNWAKRKPILFSLVFVVGLLLVPIIFVYILFSNPAPIWLRVKWSAGELLDYLGSIIGALATIFAILITIDLTHEEQQLAYQRQKEEHRLAIMPRLQTTYKPLSQAEINTLIGKNTIYIICRNDFENAIPSISTTVPSCLKKDSRQNGNHVFLYSIRNVGAGNAIELNFLLNHQAFAPTFALTTNSSLNFIFVFKQGTLRNPKNTTVFSFDFSDVISYARYHQEERINMYIDKDNNFITIQNASDLISSPIIL